MQRRAPRGGDHEGIRRGEVRPRRGKAQQLAGLAVDVHAIFAPGAAAIGELEFPPAERVERVGYPDGSCRMRSVACS